MFTSEVQFGHAGSHADSDRETAIAKNKALQEAGAYVPESFDELGDLIQYDKLSGFLQTKVDEYLSFISVRSSTISFNRDS